MGKSKKRQQASAVIGLAATFYGMASDTMREACQATGTNTAQTIVRRTEQQAGNQVRRGTSDVTNRRRGSGKKK